jgi:flagellar biosynthetic protein FliS
MSAAARRALAAYGAVHTQTVADGADPATLVRLLFDGVVDALLDGEGRISRNHRLGKAKALQKATEIILALKASLNTEAGGELAGTLDELYSYCLRRLLHANLHNDLVALKEVRALLEELRSGWGEMAKAQVKAQAKGA